MTAAITVKQIDIALAQCADLIERFPDGDKAWPIFERLEREREAMTGKKERLDVASDRTRRVTLGRIDRAIARLVEIIGESLDGDIYWPILERLQLEREAMTGKKERLDAVRARAGSGSARDQHTEPEEKLFIGAAEIAGFLGITRRQVYRLVHDGIMPSFKLGGTIAARKSSLKRWLDGLEEAHAPKP